jgi:hypothetical protein
MTLWGEPHAGTEHAKRSVLLTLEFTGGVPQSGEAVRCTLFLGFRVLETPSGFK